MGRFAPPSELAAVDQRLDEVVMRALERDRKLRFQNVNEIRTEIDSITRSPTSPVKPSAEPLNLSTGAPRFCRLSMVGSFFLPFGLIVVFLMMMTTTSGPAGPGESDTPFSLFQFIAIYVLLPLGILSPFVCTILGSLSISRIRASQGQRIGMPLAVGLGLFYPLLVLDAALLLVASIPDVSYKSTILLITIVFALLLDISIYCLGLWFATRKRRPFQ